MKRTPMAEALLQSSATKNAQLVSMEPDVKSSKTFKLFNAGVSGNRETAKSADPTCYNSVTVELTGLFDNVEKKAMAIYTRLGAPVRIVEAEKRTRWWCMKPGRSEVFDTKPTARQLRGASEVDEFEIWWIKAVQTGAYPDGTGAEHIGRQLPAYEDKTKRGFVDETFFRADEGTREIHAECEMIAAEKAA